MVKEYKPIQRDKSLWLLADQKTGKLFETDQIPGKEVLDEIGLQYQNPDMALKIDYSSKVASLIYVGKSVPGYELEVHEYNKD